MPTQYPFITIVTFNLHKATPAIRSSQVRRPQCTRFAKWWMASTFLRPHNLRLDWSLKCCTRCQWCKIGKRSDCIRAAYGFNLMGRPKTYLSMRTLASLDHSCWLAHQQGGLFKEMSRNTLYSMCTFESTHFMELWFQFSSLNLRQRQWCTLG